MNPSDNMYIQQKNKENYPTPELYQNHSFEQYKHFIDISLKYWEQMNSVNTFFISANTAILTGLSYLIIAKLKFNIFIMLAPTIAAILFCIQWLLIIRSLQKTNRARMITIQEMESFLPFQPYTVEWKRLSEKGQRYIRIQILYMIMPISTMLIYVTLLIYILTQ